MTWLRSVTTKPLEFGHPLMWTSIKDQANKKPCYCERDKMSAESTLQTAGVNESKFSVVTFDDNVSGQTSLSAENANVNAGFKRQRSDINVGYKHQKDSEKQLCRAKEKETGEEETEVKIIKSMVQEDECDSGVKRRKQPDPWKRPPGMDQQTFERYMKEIVGALKSVIPSNPFAVPRDPCVNVEPNCERIRLELEGLLAAVDGCPTSTPPCPCTPAAVRSGCWHC